MYDITYMWNLKKPNSLEIESKMVVTRGGRLGFGMKVKVASCVRLFATPWTIQSTEFSKPEYWSG